MLPTKDRMVVNNVYKVFGPEPEAAIELARQGLGKDEIFRRTSTVVAVNDVSMQVKEKQIFVVMGLSGSGKSTLVRCFNRLFEPTSGSIELDGEDILKADDEELRQIRLNKITMVFQHFALFPHRTVAENAEYGLKVRGLSAEERRTKALEALKAVGLDAWADSYPQNLSGGMQQRVGLARALAVDPVVMLMDEPFSALDPLIRRQMQDELLQLQHRLETTIIFITHDLQEALKLGHQIAIMKDGRFVQVGTPEEIVTRPADEYVTSFTQDVDRGRVLTVRSIRRPVESLVMGKDTVGAARFWLKDEDVDALCVIDERDRPQGLVLARDLLVHDADELIDVAVRREFTTVGEDAQLYDIYESCAAGMPLIVIDDEGHLSGVVNPRDIFAHLHADSGDSAEAAGAAEDRLAPS